MRRSRLPIYKAMDTLDFTPGDEGVTTTAEKAILSGPITFVSARFDFTCKTTEVFGGNGWLTVAFVRTSDAKKGGLESFNERDVIAFRTWSISEVPVKSYGCSYVIGDKPFCLRTKNRRKVSADEAVHVWIKVVGKFENNFNLQGDIVLYYHS